MRRGWWPTGSPPADNLSEEESVRAAVITALTGPDAVEIQEVAEPAPNPNQVLVDVSYAGVVFPDVLQTRGEYQLRPDLPFTPGWEVSGVVRADAGGFQAGDRVAAMPVLGGL
jgi:NADPH:quinone reductase